MKLKSLRLFTSCLAVALAVFSGCSRQSGKPGSSGRELRGQILGVDTTRGTLRVHHEEIAGFMPAMTMDFTAPDAALSSFRDGQHIVARLVEGKPGEFQLEGIRVLDAQKDGDVSAAALTLRQDTHTLGKHAFREVGEAAPSFALYNQDGAVVRFAQFRGKRVILNFIFTRCPVPNMCPAATAKMMALQKAVKEAGVTDVEFVSISFDTAYDTPPVLKQYAQTRGIDTTNFNFLTGPETAIADLLVQFGVIANPDDVFRHTLSTVLIDAKGRIPASRRKFAVGPQRVSVATVSEAAWRRLAFGRGETSLGRRTPCLALLRNFSHACAFPTRGRMRLGRARRNCCGTSPPQARSARRRRNWGCPTIAPGNSSRR